MENQLVLVDPKEYKFPEVESEEAKKIVQEVQDGMKIILTGIKNLSKSLK